MNTQQQNAILQAKLDSQWEFRKQSAYRNGLPEMPDRILVGNMPGETKEIIREVPTSVKISKTDLTAALEGAIKSNSSGTGDAKTTVDAVVDKGNKTVDFLKKAAIIGGIAAGGSGLTVLGTSMFGGDDATTVVSPVIEVPATGKPRGDWMKWLEDEGYNLPPSRMIPGESNDDS